MNEDKESRKTRYLKYIIPFLIVLAAGLFLFFRFGFDKKTRTEGIEREAMKRIEALKGEIKGAIDMERADHFIDSQTALTKKERKIITTTPKALLEDPSIGPKSEIKVMLEEERTIITTPKELLKRRTVGPDTPIRLLKEDGQFVQTTPGELMGNRSFTPDTPIKVIEKEEKVIVTTPEDLLKRGLSAETPIRVIVEEPVETITLSQLLPDERGLEGEIFYIHTVTGEDVQGIWGIIQHGLMDRFLKGIPVDTGEGIVKESVLTLQIPEYADEPLDDGYSSYFGRVLTIKTRGSYVYNYISDRMGRNPDYIYPGQEIVISRFSQKELGDIYKHFSQNP